jgi:hypothetical protein
MEELIVWQADEEHTQKSLHVLSLELKLDCANKRQKKVCFSDPFWDSLFLGID